MQVEIKAKKFYPKINPRDERIIRKIFVENFSNKEKLIKDLRSYVDILKNENQSSGIHNIAKKHSADKVAFQACCSLLSDILSASWDVKVGIDGFQVTNPNYEKIKKDIGNDETKKMMRTVQLVNRDSQLRKKDTQKFILDMEKFRIFGKERKSIKHLIDDGSDLKNIFVKANKIKDYKEKVDFLKKYIQPEIVPCYPSEGYEDVDNNCPITGLKNNDIWRYFRLTWSSEFKTTPGKTFPFLIRNVARKNSPIMGIAMLRSAALGDKARDDFIGWSNEETLRLTSFKTEKKAEKVIKYLLNTVDQEIQSIRYDDFGLSELDIKKPSEKTLKKLFKIFSSASKERTSNLKFNKVKVKNARKGYLENTINFLEESNKPLFKKKRALKLMRILEARIVFNQVNLEKDLIKGYKKLLKLKGGIGETVVNRVLNIVKYDCLAENIMDVSVCGSIAPYSEIIGGKLIAALMASKEVRDFYRKRYLTTKQFKKPAVISSSIKGGEVFRDANLLCLTTTSLYGNSSQYNRIKFLKEKYSYLETDVIWHEVRKNNISQKTAGMGVYHLSDTTTKLLDLLTIKKLKRKEINNVFGEGSAPKLRKVSIGIKCLLDDNRAAKNKSPYILAEDFLKHNIQRKNYIISLSENLLSDLLNPKKQFSTIKLSTISQISNAWIERWVVNRIQREDTLKKLNKLNAKTVSASLNFEPDSDEINLFNYENQEAS